VRRSSADRLFHTDGPETENARRPNEVRVRTSAYNYKAVCVWFDGLMCD